MKKELRKEYERKRKAKERMYGRRQDKNVKK